MSNTPRRFIAYILVALIIVVALGLQIFHFDNLNYRQDEMQTIHAAQHLSVQQTVYWLATTTHPPPWRLAAIQWVQLVGLDEGMTRFFSTLISSLTLAFTFRLANDLFDRRTGALATLLLASTAVFQFYGHELRPYPALMLGAVAAQFFFLRWLRRPNFPYAMLYVAAGILTIYMHYYGLFVILAQAVVFIWLARPGDGRYIRAFGLFIAIGLSFSAWILPFLHTFLVAEPGGIGYAADEPEQLLTVLSRLQIRPAELGTFLLIAALLTPVARIYQGRPLTPFPPENRLRFSSEWRRWYVLGYVLLLMSIVLLSNALVQTVTARNLVILLPALMIVLAYAIQLQPRQLRWVMAVLIAIPAFVSFENLESQLPFREVLNFISPTYQPGSPIIMNTRLGATSNITSSYNLLNRLSGVTKFDLIQLTSVSTRNAPEPLVNYVPDATPADLEQFWSLIGEHEQVYYVGSVEENSIGRFYIEALQERFAPLRWESWLNFSSSSVILTEYRRLPAELTLAYTFGDTFALLNWSLKNDVNVQRCQQITFESWWTSEQLTEIDYSMTLVLADSNGIGVTRNDRSPGYLETSDWMLDGLYPDVRSLTIPCDIQPGEYPLLIGLYNPLDPDNALPVALSDGARLASNLVYMTTLFVQ